jgi:alpha-mannosidase
MKIKFLISIFVFTLLLTHEAQSQQKTYFTGGVIHVVPSSHQDIAWMDTPEKCIEFRDEKMITPALKRLAESPMFHFGVENAMNLYEYLERHPERFEEIAKYTREGRLEWGANFNQPYEGMYNGEALIRQTYLGKKRLQKMIPGAEFTCAWDEDVPGRTLQRAQMLAKAGVKYLQFSRFEPGVYNWFSPDGSHISCWTPGQYECSGRPIRYAKTEADRTEAFSVMLENWDSYFKERNLSSDFIYISSHDFSTPLDYDSYFADWNEKVKNGQSKLPTIKYSTGSKSLASIVNGGGQIDSIMGERPSIWLYIHGPGHEQALKAGRKASRTLTAAEKFAAIDALLKKDMLIYPQTKLEEAWENAIYPDHGWGGNWGNITDKLFKTKFETAVSIADSILQQKTKDISGMIKLKNTGIPIVVFNSLSWKRTDPVEVLINTEGIYTNQFMLKDENGKSIEYQFISANTTSTDSEIKLLFVATDIPPIGYKTYYLVPGQAGESHNVGMVYDNGIIDSRYYQVRLGVGGVSSIFDKRLQRELIQEDKFLCGEVFSMESVGHGAGEFTEVQQPTMNGFEKMSQYSTSWQLVEQGIVRTVLETAHPWKNCTVKQRLIIYNQIKKIDFEVDILGFNGERNREFRVAFPLQLDNAQVAYRVPMAVVEVGKTEIPVPGGFSKPEQIYSTPCTEIHPREVQDWFGAYTQQVGVTISSDVAVFDYIDPTTNPVDYTVLQPLLFATRRSCNGSPATNWYLQRGDHYFHYSFTSHKGDWKAGREHGEQENNPLVVQVIKQQNTGGDLPETFSFASTDKENIIISTIKKCEDDNSIVVRGYNIEGKKTEALLHFFKPISSLYKTNIIEEEPKKLKLTKEQPKLLFGGFSIETFKLN